MGGPAFKRGARSTALSSGSDIGCCGYHSSNSGEELKATAIRKRRRPKRKINDLSAPHSLTELSATVLKHGVKIEGRAANNVENIGSRRLLLQRLPQFVEQPRVLDGDDSLSSETLTSAICFSVNGFTSCRRA